MIRAYETDGESFVRRQEESWLECINRRLKNRIPEATRNLYNICYYYHLIRNSAAHSGIDKKKNERKIAYDNINKDECAVEAMFSKLNAPNEEDKIGFDDFVFKIFY